MFKSIDDWGDDLIDSRDIIERLAECRSELDLAYDDYVEGHAGEPLDFDEWAADRDTLIDEVHDGTEVGDALVEWRQLREIEEECSHCAEDWRYGATLIHDRYFEDYARDMAEDIGAISREQTWPASHIDWAAAADALKQDYSEVEVLGHTYWVR